MDNNLLKLYPQFTQLTDRRQQQKQPVDSERRLGEDRRQSQRVGDSKLNNDIDKIQDTYKAFIHNTDQFQSSVNNLDNGALKNKEVTKAVFAALSPIVPIRRISSLPDNVEDGNYARAAGLIGLAIVNLPEDTNDLKSAWKQVRTREIPSYYKDYQAPFSFFRGTFLEPLVNILGKFGAQLHKLDVALFYTKFGEKLQELLNIDMADTVGTERKVPQIYMDEAGKTSMREIEVEAVKLSGKTLPKLIGRAMLRIPVISVIALSALEIPAIIKSFKKNNALENKFTTGFKQIIKSITYVISMISGIALIGALFAKKGPAYSVLGMGAGSVISAFTSKQVVKIIDKQ